MYSLSLSFSSSASLGLLCSLSRSVFWAWWMQSESINLFPCWIPDKIYKDKLNKLLMGWPISLCAGLCRSVSMCVSLKSRLVICMHMYVCAWVPGSPVCPWKHSKVGNNAAGCGHLCPATLSQGTSTLSHCYCTHYNWVYFHSLFLIYHFLSWNNWIIILDCCSYVFSCS